ncbi:Hypothetical predicted protein, partial [Mytilus galloprovincialis]
GMILKKVHRIIRFEQSPCNKPYIDLNTELRALATGDAEKDFYKLMNNSVFGKTIENIRKRVDIRLVNILKLMSKPNFDRRVVFKENLAALHMTRTKLTFDKPVYLGACILDISTLLMNKFHYGFIREMFCDNAQLLFTDPLSIL